jgi:hypothetical protein
VLGVIDETEREMWNVRGTFAPAVAFDATIASVFARKAALAEQLEEDDDDAVVAAFDALEAQTSPPELELVGDDGRAQDFGLLYVEGNAAGFRLV